MAVSAKTVRVSLAAVVTLGVFIWSAYRVTASRKPPDDLTVGLWQVPQAKDRHGLRYTAAFRFDGQRVGLLDSLPGKSRQPRFVHWFPARWLNNRLYVQWDTGWGEWSAWKDGKFIRTNPDHTAIVYERIKKSALDTDYAGLFLDQSPPGAGSM